MRNGIRRVVWIPSKLDEKIEDTRKRIGYTRSAFYRYAVTRLLEQMSILSKPKEIQLRPWDEITGILCGLEANDFEISAILSYTRSEDIAITFPKNSQEATLLKQNLNNLLGQKIAILKTDNPQQPLIIKILGETTVADNYPLALLLFRSSMLCVAFKDFRLVALKFALMRLGPR